MQKSLPLLLALTALAPLSGFADTAGSADTASSTVLGFHDESEAGIAITTGNARSQSYNLKQVNTYGWDMNLFKFNGKYLDSSSGDVNTARYWTLGLRYERELVNRFSVFAAETIESDIFSGYLQRYNSDVGGKYFIYKEETFYWDVEAGYRYTIENRFDGQVKQNYLRAYTEASKDWTKTFTTKADIEYLPNLTDTNDYQLNADIALVAAINDVFAVKSGYSFKYRKVPPPPAAKALDTIFTTSLVAKF